MRTMMWIDWLWQSKSIILGFICNCHHNRNSSSSISIVVSTKKWIVKLCVIVNSTCCSNIIYIYTYNQYINNSNHYIIYICSYVAIIAISYNHSPLNRFTMTTIYHIYIDDLYSRTGELPLMIMIITIIEL
jgi:hypothetical protein